MDVLCLCVVCVHVCMHMGVQEQMEARSQIQIVASLFSPCFFVVLVCACVWGGLVFCVLCT